MTFVVQSSSVFTSAITPLIGESFLLEEQVEHKGKNVSKVSEFLLYNLAVLPADLRNPLHTRGPLSNALIFAFRHH